MEADAVVMELLSRDIISKGDEVSIAKTNSPQRQNELLHVKLMNKCTYKALKTVCEIFSKVDGNPKLKALGEDMMKCLETSNCKYSSVYVRVCVCVCVCVCMCVCVCVCTPQIRLVGMAKLLSVHGLPCDSLCHFNSLYVVDFLTKISFTCILVGKIPCFSHC